MNLIVPVDQLPPNVDRQHFHEIGAICVFVLRCRAKEQVENRSTTSSDVDDSGLQPFQPIKGTSIEDHASSDTADSEGAEVEPQTILGFMNDGSADKHRFGLDGEGPGPVEQKSWSWSAPQPSHPAGPGQQGAYVPIQQPPTHIQPYGNYGQTQGFLQSAPPGQPGQLGPSLGQGQPPSHRPQRHVHFNDQIPRQPTGFAPPDHRLAEQNFTTNIGQSNLPSYPQQPNNYASFTPSDYTHPATTSYGAVPQGYVHPSPLQAPMIPTAQDHGTDFSIGAEQGYAHPVPSYLPVGYGAPAYTSWPPAVHPPAYAQSTWSVQPMPGPSYLKTPSLAPPLQPSYPYPYLQPQFPGGPVAPAPYHNSSHPGGGVWGPPPANPGSQDPAKDENNQLDGQSNQNLDCTANAAGQSIDNNDQGWDNNADKTQAGDSGWNNNDAGGGQNDNWDATATHTEAPTPDWNQSTFNTDQTNNAESTWNTTANPSAQVQDSWNNALGSGQQNMETFSMSQHDPAARVLSAQHRPLYGPHGPYHQTVTTSTNGRPQPDAGEEPPYDVPEDMPTTHQVKPGEGYMYVHKRRSPRYLDTLEEPYARFIFKYRTKEQIENETGIKVEDEPTGDEEKRKLQVMDKDEIIEMLLRAKIALGASNVTAPAPTLSPIPNEYTSSVGTSAVPAPAYNFLHYSVPKARTNSRVPPSAIGNVGLGVTMPATPAAAATTTQDWAGNNSWGNASVASANTAPAADIASRQAQQQTAATWPAPAAFAQPSPQAQAPADTWSAQAPNQAQQQPPIVPLQFNPTIQTYKPPSERGGPPVVPHQPAFAANGRPITPPHGGWGGHTAASSSAGDNGMAGWDATGTAGGGGGWGGEAAASQPSGNW